MTNDPNKSSGETPPDNDPPQPNSELPSPTERPGSDVTDETPSAVEPPQAMYFSKKHDTPDPTLFVNIERRGNQSS